MDPKWTDGNELEYLKQVLQNSSGVRKNPFTDRLEKAFIDKYKVNYAIALNSGASCLHSALVACGVKPGDEVITSPFSVLWDSEIVLIMGAKIVFADVKYGTHNIDPKKVEKKITSKTKAIIPVSLYGQCAAMDRINEIAATREIPVLEDAAQSFGATYEGRHSCGLSQIVCTSFFPAKPLGCYGDGGAIFTNDNDLANKIRMIVNHGEKIKYHHEIIGCNSR